LLVVTPSITIRDRLRVLLPNDSENLFLRLDRDKLTEFR